MKTKIESQNELFTSSAEGILYKAIRDLILNARKKVVRGVDLVQVHTNFEIGRHIVKQEQKGKNRAEYGDKILKTLAARLTVEFGKGFSQTNLKLVRQFYLQNKHRIGQSLTDQLGRLQRSQSKTDQFKAIQSTTGQFHVSTKKIQVFPFTLSWTHYVFLLGIKNPEERSFYEIEATEQNWTVRELRRQFNSSLYERLALSRNRQRVRKLAQKGQEIVAPQDLLKEPLVLEFLGLDEKAGYSESELETSIINHIEKFLLELGKGFLFEARQKRFTFDDDHFFVDLVFYNRLLQAYVLIDLKIGKLTHQDLGQMQMYVNYFDRFVKTNTEKPTIGIVLCKEKKDTLVKITLPKKTNIHAKEYQLYLPSKEELQKKLAEWAKGME